MHGITSVTVFGVIAELKRQGVLTGVPGSRTRVADSPASPATIEPP